VPRTHECDVLVIGSGAGGFASAITARKAGLDVLMVEKANVFGGTTATSGGIIWIPANPLAARSGVEDNLEDCRLYLRRELGNAYSPALIEAYLQRGPEMVTFFVDEIGIPFTPLMRMPDYHPEQPGASSGGRSLQVVSVHASILGDELKRLRPLPPELSLFGMGVSSGSDLRHLYKFGRSLESSIKVANLLAKFGYDKLRYGRGMSLVLHVRFSTLVRRFGHRRRLPSYFAKDSESLEPSSSGMDSPSRFVRVAELSWQAVDSRKTQSVEAPSIHIRPGRRSTSP